MAGASGSGPIEGERVRAHGAPNTAPAFATILKLADLGVLYGGPGPAPAGGRGRRATRRLNRNRL